MFDLKFDLVLLLFDTNEPPNLDSSNTAPDAGLLDIADKFPPRAPKAPPIAEYLAFPLSFSMLQFTASVISWV